MDNPKQHVIDTLKEANNILVTVRNNPTIDQLAACIALTLVINELGKHGTAVFSGHVPSALGFLEPEKTIEKNTDSLQDFIISLDKAKADKLRYKIEDTVVKIFITPYRTSLSPADLNFEPGDFNVDVVVALGVHNQDDVDTAITEHGRILHDATVLSINVEGGPSQDLGSIAWIDEKSSSLSEMIAEIANELGKEDAIDNQVATALLTGIVAETERFGNNKVTPETMQVASKLLTAGANQELVAAKLSEPEPITEPLSSEDVSAQSSMVEPLQEAQTDDAGSLEIDHPTTPLSTFAKENDDFQIPQPEAGTGDGATPHADEGQGTDTPDVIDLNHFNDPAPQAALEDNPPAEPEYQPGEAGQPTQSDGDQPSFTQPPLETETPAANSEQDLAPAMGDQPQAEDFRSDVSAEGQSAEGEPVAESVPQEPTPDQQELLRQQREAEALAEQAEERAALDYLKDRRVDTQPRAFVEPLRRRAIEPIHRQDELEEGGQGHGVEGSKYSFTPPTLGGTLTANLPNERAADSLDRQADAHQAHAPLLSHGVKHATVALVEQPVLQEAPVAKPVETAAPEPLPEPLMDSLPQAPTPTLEQLEQQVQSHRNDTETADRPAEFHDDPRQTASLITPLIDSSAPASSPQPAPASTTTHSLPSPVNPSESGAVPPPVPPPVQAAMR